MTSLGLGQPHSQELGSRRPHDSSVQINERCDGKPARVHDLSGLHTGTPQTSRASPPRVGVDVHKTRTSVVRLLAGVPVQPHAAGREPRKCHAEELEPDPATAELRVHEVQPDPSVRLVPTRCQDDANGPTVDLSDDPRIGVDLGERLHIVDARVPPLLSDERPDEGGVLAPEPTKLHYGAIDHSEAGTKLDQHVELVDLVSREDHVCGDSNPRTSTMNHRLDRPRPARGPGGQWIVFELRQPEELEQQRSYLPNRPQYPLAPDRSPRRPHALTVPLFAPLCSQNRTLPELATGRSVEIRRIREGAMSDVARNIEVVERLERAYNARDYDTVRANVASDLVPHTAGSEGLPPGVEGAIAANEGSFQAFSDKDTEILEIFGDGDRVVSHVRMTGTHDGELAFAGLPPTGKSIDLDWIQISRHADDGTIQETWSQMDLPTMMVQLGVMPAPEGM